MTSPPAGSRLLVWLRWQRVPAASMNVRAPAREGVFATAYAATYVAAAFLIALLIRRGPLPLWGASDFPQDFWYAAIFKGVLLLALPVLAFHGLGYGARDVLPGWRPGVRALLAVAIAFVLGACINLNRLREIRGVVSTLPAGEALGRVATGAALALLTAGLPEEFFFRGILQTRLERTLGRTAALVLTVVLFTAWHVPSRYVLAHGVEGEAGNLRSVLLGTGAPVAVVALVLGVGWDRYRNLPVLIGLHWGIDLLPVVGSMLRIPPS